jgi:hypothetical protein
VGRVAPADRRGHPQRPAGLDALDVDGLAAVEHGQVAGLAGVVDEPLEERQCLVPEVHLLHHQPAELEDPQPQPVAAGARVALHQAGGVEVHHEAVDGGLVQPQALGQLGDPELGVLRREGVEDRHRPLDGLDAVARADPASSGLGAGGDDRGIERVSHPEHLSCN